MISIIGSVGNIIPKKNKSKINNAAIKATIAPITFSAIFNISFLQTLARLKVPCLVRVNQPLRVDFVTALQDKIDRAVDVYPMGELSERGRYIVGHSVF